jgi:hypothetical protein
MNFTFIMISKFEIMFETNTIVLEKSFICFEFCQNDHFAYRAFKLIYIFIYYQYLIKSNKIIFELLV